ncbi:hypothetical protein [Leptothoe spongobia]|uniref:Uncharacterized protein n=1 Tax=Leptothoe spongobia TAU-MAC 1115 TaxID=1967444 RepID=A0A947GKJ1_9CYAN|nr:hypothetical protein [Leptothoe spongobia]MBT9317845.1 hypothetical protein [Leptothoe spongobia TAU-MAC 1115]
MARTDLFCDSTIGKTEAAAEATLGGDTRVAKHDIADVSVGDDLTASGY